MSGGKTAESVGATVLAAAYEQYVDSERTPGDWTDFVESVAHAMAPLSHSFPCGQPALTAGALTEFPRSGMTATEIASGASGSLQRSPAASFEALLDDLFLLQGWGNSHHIGAAAAARAGSRIALGGINDMRLLSSTCYRSLKDLFLAHDPTLEALFAQYRDLGGAASPVAYKDFLQSLLALATRWKRFVFYRESPSDYDTRAQVLFSVLDELLQRGLISFGEHDFVEDLLYSHTHGAEALARYAHDGTEQGAGDEFLFAAWDVAYETLAPEAGASAAQQGKAVAEFYDSLLHLLERQVSLIYARYTHEARAFLRQLGHSSHQLPPASLKHLYALIAHQEALEEAQHRGISLQLTPAQEAMSKQSCVLFAAFAESAQTQNSFELLDSLQLIGAAWKKHTPHTVLLNCLTYLHEQQLLSGADLALLERQVYEQDAALLSAWREYASIEHDADAAFTKAKFDELVGRVRQCVTRAWERDMEMLARNGYALINALSVAPDPLPQLHSDPARMHAVGLPPSVELSGAVPLLELPDELRAVLSVQHSIVLRDLCARRDPAFLAVLQQFEEGGDVDDLLDGLDRLVARELDVSGKRRAAAAEAQAADEEALDVFQLCAMLTSLHSDGFLATHTYEQLLSAVREARDPVLLAAFSLYKECLSRGDHEHKGWRELWNTLQLAWQRIQRDAAAAVEDDTRAGNDKLSLLGAQVLDALSASNAISITSTLYLRDLLRKADPTLMAELSLHAKGETQPEELRDTLVLLSQRWQQQLPAEERACVRLLTSLCHNSRLFSPRALDYLLGQVYARDVTLAAVYSLYADVVRAAEAETAKEESGSEQEERKYSVAASRSSSGLQHIAAREKALREFVDTIRIILKAGNRTITQLNGGAAAVHL